MDIVTYCSEKLIYYVPRDTPIWHWSNRHIFPYTSGNQWDIPMLAPEGTVEQWLLHNK